MSISAAESGIKAPGINLSESFGNARGISVRAQNNFNSDFSFEDSLGNSASSGYVDVMHRSSEIQISPLATAAGSQRNSGQDQNGQKTTEDVMGAFVAKMKDTSTSPAQDKLNNTKYHDNIGGHLKTAEGKAQEASQKTDDLKTAAKDTAKHLTATGQESLAAGLVQPQGKDNKGMGFVGGMALEAGITGVASLANPLLGVGVGAAIMAKTVMDLGQGQGTEVTFNKTPTSFPMSVSGKTGSKQAKADAGYFRSEPSPQQTGTTMTAAAAPAPEANRFNDKISRGPGFGPKFDTGRAELASQSLEGMLVKIAEDSPAGKTANTMAKNASIEIGKHEIRAEKGVEATAENLARAQDTELKQTSKTLKIENAAPTMT